MKTEHRQFLTFRVPDQIGASILASAPAGHRVVDCIDQFFLRDARPRDAKPDKKIFRLRQELTGGLCFGDMRTFKKDATKLRRSRMCQSTLQALLRNPQDTSLRPEAWKIPAAKRLQPSIQAHFQRVEIACNSKSLLTIDRDIRCRSLQLVEGVSPSYCQLSDVCLVTMQFAEILPSVFKQLVFDFRLNAESASLLSVCALSVSSFELERQPLEQNVA